MCLRFDGLYINDYSLHENTDSLYKIGLYVDKLKLEQLRIQNFYKNIELQINMINIPSRTRGNKYDSFYSITRDDLCAKLKKMELREFVINITCNNKEFIFQQTQIEKFDEEQKEKIYYKRWAELIIYNINNETIIRDGNKIQRFIDENGDKFYNPSQMLNFIRI